MSEYVVRQGDCISSVADQFGLDWEMLWNHPKNASLKSLRKDPNILLPGDRLFVPEPTLKVDSGATGLRHRFLRRGVPAKLRLRLVDADGGPRKALKYSLTVEGSTKTGTTDGDGRIEESISPTAQSAHLRIEDRGRIEEYELPLGHLDPITETSGVLQRLTNLGYDCSSGTEIGERERAAIETFQRKHGLPETGEADEATRQRLEQEHES